LGATSDVGGSPDIALVAVAVVSGASAPPPAPTTTAPQPTIKTNRPALAHRATSDLPMFVIA
jgi:hypothetical protein